MDASVAKVLELVRPLAKPCLHIVCTSESQYSATGSRFGGKPSAKGGDVWPLCQCSLPLTFICQLNLSEHAEYASKVGAELVQLFYCFRCSPWGSKQSGWLVRPLKLEEVTDTLLEKPPAAPKKWFEKLANTLTGASEVSDVPPVVVTMHQALSLPSYSELTAVDPVIDEAVNRISEQENEDAYFYAQLEIAGCKESEIDYYSHVGGFANWIQDMEIVHCERCGTPMQFCFEIASESRPQLNFGDAGAVYVFNCRCQDAPHFSMIMQCH